MSASAKQTILLVDDNIVNLKVAVENLRGNGLEVLTARSGEIGLERASLVRPDLILLDVGLPGIDGFETCRRLKADAATRAIPVIFMTALADVEDKIRGFDAGGVDYITKPIQVDEVLLRVNTHLTIRRLQKTLEERIAELDAFAHTVAHDLKNPLAVVMGYVQLIELSDEPLSETLQSALKVIARNSHKMTSIVDELLIMASVRNMSEINTAPLEMGAIVRDSLERLSRLSDTSGAEIIQPESWPVAQGYAPWVEEVWANYISNAMKYGGPTPRIELGAERLPAGASGAGAPILRFWVRDYGPGMSQEQAGRLFQEFSRLDQHRSVQGHGLGLSIVQRIVAKLGGTVGVSSQPGAGSTFFFTLPASEQPVSLLDPAVPAPALEADPQLGQRHPLSILIVDDNPTNQKLLQLSLARFGYRADTADDGLQAIAAWQHNAYDLIFMDVEMPGMNGIAATRQIRVHNGGITQPRILACTANSSMAVEAQCLAAGMDGFVNKPLPLETLLAELRRTSLATGAASGSSAPAAVNAAPHIVAPAPAADDAEPLIDPAAFDRLRRMLGGDRALLLEVLESFFESAPQQLSALRQAAAQDNAPQIYMAAHTLKSLGNNFGASGFAQQCRDLESEAQGGMPVRLEQRLEELERSYQQVKAALEALV